MRRSAQCSTQPRGNSYPLISDRTSQSWVLQSTFEVGSGAPWLQAGSTKALKIAKALISLEAGWLTSIGPESLHAGKQTGRASFQERFC